MAKSKELEDYDNRQWDERQIFEDRFDVYREELMQEKNYNDLTASEKLEINRKLNKFINKEHPERGYFVKYDNFIMDVRKPSFKLFVLFVIFTIIGIISTIKYIFF